VALPFFMSGAAVQAGSRGYRRLSFDATPRGRATGIARTGAARKRGDGLDMAGRRGNVGAVRRAGSARWKRGGCPRPQPWRPNDAELRRWWYTNGVVVRLTIGGTLWAWVCTKWCITGGGCRP
jgi:hypothetical protein